MRNRGGGDLNITLDVMQKQYTSQALGTLPLL